MNHSTLSQQSNLLKNRDRILAVLKEYPNVVNVGVGLKETNDELTSTLCYRVYVNDKKPQAALQAHEIIPPVLDGFIIDVIPYGEMEEIAMNKKHYRPLVGGIQIKNEGFVNDETRGGGTLGMLAVLDDGSNKIVGLTNEHVVRLNTEIADATGIEIGQPWKVVCCCCCTKNVIGKVLKAVKRPDCAIIELDSDIVSEIQAADKQSEILTVGKISGKAVAEAGMRVKKMGAATGLTTGIIIDVAFDNDQILIAPRGATRKFVTAGDSGSIVLTEDNRVIGLLWGSERDRFKSHTAGIADESPLNNQTPLKQRVRGVAAPIEAVEEALGIKVYVPPVKATISVHPVDTLTHVVPSIKPVSAKPKKHFVTALGEGDIFLQATFDQPIDNSRISWKSNNDDIFFPAIDTDNATATISRERNEGVKSIVRVLVDGLDASDNAFVWIIWSIDKNYQPQNPIGDNGGPSTVVSETDIKTTVIFLVEFEIQPAEIIPKHDMDDVPDLKGPNLTPPPNVSPDDTHVYNQGVDLSGGAIYKWDVSKRLRCKVFPRYGVFLPPDKYNKTFLNYPSSPIVGNDDTVVSRFELDPYSAEIFNLSGKLLSDNLITLTIPHTLGRLESTLEFRIHYQLFARLEINGNWYNISDYFLWRLHLFYGKKDEDPTSEYHNDGVWYKIIAFYDKSNADF